MALSARSSNRLVVTCQRCDGTGLGDDGVRPMRSYCPRCDGTGQHWASRLTVEPVGNSETSPVRIKGETDAVWFHPFVSVAVAERYRSDNIDRKGRTAKVPFYVDAPLTSGGLFVSVTDGGSALYGEVSTPYGTVVMGTADEQHVLHDRARKTDLSVLVPTCDHCGAPLPGNQTETSLDGMCADCSPNFR